MSTSRPYRQCTCSASLTLTLAEIVHTDARDRPSLAAVTSARREGQRTRGLHRGPSVGPGAIRDRRFSRLPHAPSGPFPLVRQESPKPSNAMQRPKAKLIISDTARRNAPMTETPSRPRPIWKAFGPEPWIKRTGSSCRPIHSLSAAQIRSSVGVWVVASLGWSGAGGRLS